LRDGVLPTITHLRPDKLLRKDAFQKGFASHSRNRLKNKHPDFTFPVVLRLKVLGRMPVILHPDNYDLWLDPGMKDVGAASDLLKPYDARLMRCYPVSTRINHVADDDQECSAAVELH
jgi:hypothetical protein